MNEQDVNQRVALAARPVGYPKESDFSIVEEPIPEIRDGQVLVRILWLSLDPYERGRMNEAQTYASSVPIGGTMVGGTVGRVVSSRRDDLPVGEYVEGSLGWQAYAVSEGHNLRRVDHATAPISTALGVLGMPGLTAYFGLFEVGRPEPGDTVVVSAASGAVGAVVGQLAKIAGCRVVGIAGTQQKIDYIVDELGFDSGVSYKVPELSRGPSRGLPGGGRRILRQRRRRRYGRRHRPDGGPGPRGAVRADIPVQPGGAGAGSQEPALPGREAGEDRGLPRVPVRRQGGGGAPPAHPVAPGRQAEVPRGRRRGLTNAPKALIGMMHGGNFGKLLVKVSEE